MLFRSPQRPSRATVPVSLRPPTAEPWAEWLRSAAVDSSTNWAAGSIEGVALDAGETPVRLFEGQLALGPFDIGFGGGRLRGAPWVQLLPAPGEIVVPPGRVAERIVLAGPLADRWMTWMLPLLGRSTRTRGLVSVDMAGARLPVGDPWGGEAAGALVFESLDDAELARIVDLQLDRVSARLAAQELGIEVGKDARALLAAEGYDPQFGARPLKRAIQDLLLNPLASRLLAGEFKAGDRIVVDARGGALRLGRK